MLLTCDFIICFVMIILEIFLRVWMVKFVAYLWQLFIYLFPGNVFPVNFESTVKKIHGFLCHILAHIYQCHSQDLLLLALNSHLNTVTYHFLLFNKQFNLVSEKDLDIFEDLFERLCRAATQRPSKLDWCCVTDNEVEKTLTSPCTDLVSNMTLDEKSTESVTADNFMPFAVVT